MTTRITLRLAWHNDGWNGRLWYDNDYAGQLLVSVEGPHMSKQAKDLIADTFK